MIKKLAIGLVAISAASAFVSCNKTPDYDNEVIYSSTLVRNFKLKGDKELLANLDTVFFSIDLVNSRIFNADSLPFGTDVSRMVLNITTDNASEVELIVPKGNSDGTNKTINYLTNSTDSIDFTHGAVTLRVTSYDGKAKRDYEVKVNVHKIVPDSLCWNRMAVRTLPSASSNLTAQKATRSADKAYCLTSNGADYSLASTANPYDSDWDVKKLALSFTPDIATFTSTNDGALYILDSEGNLMASNDEGDSWSAVDTGWTWIIGAYGDKMIGVGKDGDTYYHAIYPGLQRKVLTPGFPISGTSTPASINNKWAVSQQIIVVGGLLPDGSHTSDVWGFDGTSWACISKQYPRKVADAALFSYKVAKVDTLTWTATELPVLLSFGGRDDEGKAINTMFISRDMGINWKQADNLLQLPSYISPRYDAQALVFDNTITARSASNIWEEMPSTPLPTWASICGAGSFGSRAVAPITEWECPYVYLFGGYNDSGILYNTVWRGVINRLTFKPLQ